MADATLSSPLGASRPARAPQYITAFAAALGGFVVGTVVGFSSPASHQLTTNSTGDALHLSRDQNSWFSSIVNLGALVGGPVGGLCLNTLGRRGTMMASVAPFILGWLLIVLAQNFAMLVAGRLLTGLCSGITCLAAPTYIAEYASPDIRGTLATSRHWMAIFGTLCTFGLGAVVPSWRWLAGLNILPLVPYFVLMFFAKESPRFLLYHGKDERAAAALQYFRGKDTHIQEELDMMRSFVEERRRNKASFSDLMKPYALKPFFISLSLMFFRQFSCISGVLFNMTTIFSMSGSTIPDDVSSVIVVVVQVVTTFFTIMLVDRVGRRLLLIASSSIMALSLAALGEFFYMKEKDEEWAEQTLGWLPLLSLMVFIAAFAIGYGPIPWLMMGELFPPNVKELAVSLATMFNWGLSFVVTLIFAPLQSSIGDAWMYWIFAGLCVLNLVFCVTVVPETKDKTLEEITASFGAPASPPIPKRRNSSDC